jgi:hypothetical protein
MQPFSIGWAKVRPISFIMTPARNIISLTMHGIGMLQHQCGAAS